MNFWRGKIAVITGAGSGIGAQIAKDLMKSGMTVIGLDNCQDKIDSMAERAEQYKAFPGNLVPIMCDVSEGVGVKSAFSDIVEKFGGVDVLVNNAGIAVDGFFSTGSIESFKKVMDTNIYGVVACTNHAVASMKQRCSRGHIININSICGHYIPPFSSPTLNMYVVSKHAMTAFTEILRQELRHLKLNIKVTSISPGVVTTSIFEASQSRIFRGDFLQQHPHLEPEDVSASVLHALAAPQHVQHHEVLLHALHEIY